METKNNLIQTDIHKDIVSGIIQEVDGFYYYYPPENGTCYASHTLRVIADKLDEINKPWTEIIEREFTPACKPATPGQSSPT